MEYMPTTMRVIGVGCRPWQPSLRAPHGR